MSTQWYYQTDGTSHGPFSNEDMLSWYHQGYLQGDLPLTTDPKSGFYPLIDWFPQESNAFQPGAMANPIRSRGVNTQIQAVNPEEQVWYFLDTVNEVQGPFSSIQMSDWHRDGFFEPILQIYDSSRNPEEWGWKPLQEYFPELSKAFNIAGQAEPEQIKEEVPERFRFPDWLPQPPPYKGVPKVYPSERNAY